MVARIANREDPDHTTSSDYNFPRFQCGRHFPGGFQLYWGGGGGREVDVRGGSNCLFL